MSDLRSPYLGQLATHSTRRPEGIITEVDAVASNERQIDSASLRVAQALKELKELSAGNDEITDEVAGVINSTTQLLELAQMSLIEASEAGTEVDIHDVNVRWSVFTDLMIAGWLERLPGSTAEDVARIDGAIQALEMVGVLQPVANPSTEVA